MRQYVKEDIEPIKNNLSQLHNKVNQLLLKGKKYKYTLPVKDLIGRNLFTIFFMNTGRAAIRQKDLKET